MEHKNLDKLFRDIIQNDDSELNSAEQTSKEIVWDELKPKPKVIAFPFWKVASAVLLILLGGTYYFQKQAMDQKDARYAQLELALEKLEREVENVKNKEQRILQASSENEITNSEEELPITEQVVIEKEYIEKLIESKDTVWLEKVLPSEEKLILVRDTVYIRVETDRPTQWTSLQNGKDSLAEKKRKMKRPKKVEFVFGNKPMAKPEQKQKIFTTPNELVKKTKKKKKNIISTPKN